jgi:putative ABC transport system ATP-binding protein
MSQQDFGDLAGSAANMGAPTVDMGDTSQAGMGAGAGMSAGVSAGATGVVTSDASREAAVRAIGLVKDYGRGASLVHALRGIDISFEKGAFTAIMGPSGSGKSTLMHTLAGLDSVTRGTVLVGGRDITKLNDKQLTLMRRSTIGFIFQSFNLLPMFDAEQNILMPLTLAGRKPDRAWMDQLVSVLGLADRLHHRPSEMSGGQQQRVAIARALITRPDVVFADEPTGNLDSVSSSEVLTLMRRLVDETGQTIVMVTHDATAASYADRAVVLADGRIVADRSHPTAEEMSSLLTSIMENLAAQHTAEGNHRLAALAGSSAGQNGHGEHRASARHAWEA